MVEKIKDYEFQTQCVEYLIDKTVETTSKQVITVKAPTGAGKTIILIKYVDEFLKNTSKNTAFVWLCPGKGNLEEQSKERMEQLAPHIDTRNLMYSMMVGFEPGSVTFINWELVTKKGNTALKDSERSNLFEKIAEAHKDGTEFVVIIDEEHLNNTKKADDVISAFAAKNIIRVSATANKVPHQEYYEISEEDVIAAGLITRAIYVNEGVDERKEILNDYEYLLDLADNKRKEIAEAYNKLDVKVRPLVLIQFPMGQPETINAVEEKLASMGYTYDNGMVNIWMSDEKIVSDDLTKLDGSPAFLLMKQAISTGWDCPRAKILVKLREGGSEDFQIQTIGRIRRMPEGKHYGLNILDYCYIYTLDALFLKAGLEEELTDIEHKIELEEKKYQKQLEQINDYEKKLTAYNEEISDVLKYKGYMEMRDSLIKEIGELVSTENAYEDELKKEKRRRKKFDDSKKQVNQRYYELMTRDKQRFGLKEISDKKLMDIKSNISAGGSNKPIATIIWYMNLLRIKKEFNPNAILFPIVFDSPNNVETDNEKRIELLKYLFESVDTDTQLIISNLGFDRNQFKEANIEQIIEITNDKYQLLNQKDYDNYKGLFISLMENDI